MGWITSDRNIYWLIGTNKIYKLPKERNVDECLVY